MPYCEAFVVEMEAACPDAGLNRVASNSNQEPEPRHVPAGHVETPARILNHRQRRYTMFDLVVRNGIEPSGNR